MLEDIAAEWGVGRRGRRERLLPAGAIYFQLDEGDVRDILAYPHAMIGSDGCRMMCTPIRAYGEPSLACSAIMCATSDSCHLRRRCVE